MKLISFYDILFFNIKNSTFVKIYTMKTSIKKTKQAYDILERYEGVNPYIKSLKYHSFVKKDKTLSDLDIEYVIKNHNYIPEKINKIVKISRWFGEKCQEKWGTEFIPEKIKITDILGETESTFHVCLFYRKSQEKPVMIFIPKKALLADLRAVDYNEMDIDFSKYEEVLNKENKSLYDHQKSAVKFLLTRNKCLLADDQGLAKTCSTVIASIEGGFKKILIICPASIKSTWKREIKRFVPESEIGVIKSTNWVDNKKYTIINYDILDLHYKIPKETIIEEYETTDKNGNIIIKTKEKEVKSRKKEIKNKALSESNLYLAGFDLVIIDECHKLSNNSSIRYEIISDFLNRSDIKNVYLMSGTPMTNRPINLYQVLALINHEVTHNYEYFVKQYCDGKKIRNKKLNRDVWLTSGSSNLDELMEKIKDSYLRRLKSDIPGMVTKEIHQRFYDLTLDERIKYDNLWNEYEESQNSVGNYNLNKDLTEGIFLRQFISTAMVKNTIELANEFIEDGDKVFIACCFDDEIAKLKEYYGDKAVIYKGGMTEKQKDKAEHDFMNNPEILVFIGNIIAAGVGLTLTSSHICIFNSYDWVPGNNDQMMDRVHRLGQKKNVEVYYQLFNDTISEYMWENIIVKKINIETVIVDENNKTKKLG